jgi:hypothetical protein
VKLLVAARGGSGQQFVNCVCACRRLATKHNESFPQKFADHKASQLPAPRRRTLPSRPGKGNKSALQLFTTARFDDETYKLQSELISDRLFFGARMVTREARRRVCVIIVHVCVHSSLLLTRLPAAFSKDSSGCATTNQCTQDHLTYCSASNLISLQQTLLML